MPLAVSENGQQWTNEVHFTYKGKDELKVVCFVLCCFVVVVVVVVVVVFIFGEHNFAHRSCSCFFGF